MGYSNTSITLLTNIYKEITMSETARHRELFKPYTQGMGVDLGYGGDPLNASCITIDLPQKYTSVGDNKPQNLFGSALDLYWFKDAVLDYVYSSHLIEDFDDTEQALTEWLRVVKVGGHLCLLFPDEQKYRSIEQEKNWNMSHKHMDFGLDYFLNILDSFDGLEVILAQNMFEHNDYNCLVVIKKVS